MDYNVLVLAMSTLPYNVVAKPGWNASYHLMKNGEFTEEEYYGLGQLEVMPQFIENHAHVRLTHIIMVLTDKTKAPVNFFNEQIGLTDPKSNCTMLAKNHDGKELDMEGLSEISHVEFFKRRMDHEGIRPVFIPKNIDEFNPAQGLEIVQRTIRDLYAEYLSEQKETPDAKWNLWLDTHGGFREISMAMFGLMQMLAAPDEQELAEYVVGDELKSKAIAQLSDGLATIPITGVYSVSFDPGRSLDEPNPIVDLTEFYSTFTRPAITAYMNYGQYAQTILRSIIEPDKDGNVPPYAFISYRSTDATKER